MPAILQLNDFERFILIDRRAGPSSLRDVGNRDERRPAGRGDRNDLRRTRDLVRALGGKAWDAFMRTLSDAGEQKAREAGQTDEDAIEMAGNAAQVRWIGRLKEDAQPSQYRLQPADVEYLRDHLRTVAEAKLLLKAQSETFASLLDRVDTAYEHRLDPDVVAPANGSASAEAVEAPESA